MDTQTLVGVPIFDVGTWNGATYTVADLDAMVAAFDALKGTLDPPMKLGHSEHQRLLQEDGYPAAGWIEKLYRRGTQLVADITHVPRQVAELIRAGGYRKVSSEIWFDADVGGQKYPRVLAAVALLGEELPAVSTLGDVVALYRQARAAAVARIALTPGSTRRVLMYAAQVTQSSAPSTTSAQGSTSGAAPRSASVIADELNGLVAAAMRADAKLTFATALNRVSRTKRELALEYVNARARQSR